MGDLPLSCSLLGWDECDAELFEWMAKQYPEAMSHRNRLGMTCLHYACEALASTPEEGTTAPSKCTENTSRICRFLISECPEAVRTKGRRGNGLPIHYLARRCNRPLVQDLIILSLRHYPQAVNVKAVRYLPELSTVPFIQKIAPLLQQEADLKAERVWLSQARTNFGIYTDSLDETATSIVQASVVFSSWASNRITNMPAKEEALKQQIAEIQTAFQEDDIDSDTEDEDNSDDEDGLDAFVDSEEEDDDESIEDDGDDYSE